MKELKNNNSEPEKQSYELPTLSEIKNENIIMFSLDEEGKIIYADDELVQFLETGKENILGRKIEEFLHFYILGNLKKNEISFVDYARNFKENVYIDFLIEKTGERKTLNCEFKYSNDFTVLGWNLVVIGRNVFLLKQLERYIEIIQETSQQLLSFNFDMTIRLDNNRIIKSINHSCEKQMECSKSYIVEKHINDILARKRDMISLEQAFIQASNFKNVYDLKIDLKVNGKIIPTLVNVSALRDSFNNDIGYTLVLHNVEEETRMDSVLKRLETIDKMNALGELAVGISHQTKNYLNAINTGLLLLETEITNYYGDIKLNKSGFISHLNEVKNNLAKLTWLTKHLLNFANNQKPLLDSLGNVNDVLKCVYDLVLDTVRKHKAQIKLELTDNLPPLFFSPLHLEQAILNLVNNAIDALPEEGGRILIKSFIKENKWICITIEDNGSGIPDDLKHEIFNIFVTTKPVGKGTGLGLYVAKDVISLLKGTIDVKSEIGKGTVFAIKLPIRKKKIGMMG